MMNEIKGIYEVYLKEQDSTRGPSQERELNKKIFSELSEMLVDSCYSQAESDINAYVNCIEENAFTAGFRAAMKLMMECTHS